MLVFLLRDGGGIAEGIVGNGELGERCVLEAVDEDDRSISGSVFERKAEWVSSWKRPPPFFPPWTGGGSSVPKSNSPPEKMRFCRSG